ncbi:hypothetical protein AVEN_213882-1 [Araneus ventricosus]|uniref:Uncharacterized protein n=1 Tax=Araneus ventricosus TaxID=182803 RepID=A0A4Y2WS93_ARAVE|nr:hypothetical protein AVEN_213882-1 [Araneus ventricosus]
MFCTVDSNPIWSRLYSHIHESKIQNKGGVQPEIEICLSSNMRVRPGLSGETGPILCYTCRKPSSSLSDGSKPFVANAHIALPVFEICWLRANPKD